MEGKVGVFIEQDAASAAGSRGDWGEQTFNQALAN